MVQLDKLHISNARRLGKNVSIEFGKGVTILLAPNGTGKTTIFEAIELAITGEIQRLRGNNGAIIGDKSENMSVELCFSNNQVTKLYLDQNGKCTRDGDIRKILDVQEDVSIPYLFKMTHFFEQNSKNWFVGSGGTEAGKLLSSLPISKDIQNVLSKKISVLRTITGIENRCKTELDLLYSEFEQFEELYFKLNNITDNVPHYDKHKMMNEILALLKKYDVMLKEGEGNLETISTKWELMRNKILEAKDKNSLEYNKLSSFDERISFYIANQIKIGESDSRIKSYEEDKINKEYAEEEERNRRTIVLSKIAALEKKKGNAEREVSQFNEKDIKRKNIVEKQKEIEKYEAIIRDCQKSIESNQVIIETYCKMADQHKGITESLENAKKKLIALKNNLSNIKMWESNLKNIQELSVKLHVIDNDLELIRKDKIDKEKQLMEETEKQKDKKDELISLRKSSREIENALSLLRQNIEFNTKICPVCQAEYRPGVLQKRISTALVNLNPLIDKAIVEEKELAETVRSLENILNQLEKEISELRKKQDEISSKISDLQASNENLRLAGLIDTNNIIDETTRLEQAIIKQKDIILELQDRKNILPLIKESEYDSAQEKKDSQERQIKRYKSLIDSIKLEIANDNNAVNVLAENLDGKDINQYLSIVSECLLEIKKLSGELDECNTRCKTLQKEIDKLEADILSEKNRVSSIRAAQDNISEEWKHFNIGSIPSLRRKEEKCNSLKNLDMGFERDLRKLYDLQNTLTEWKNYEAGEDIKKKIKDRIGDNTPETFYEKLKEKIAKKEAEKDNIKIRKEAVDAFYDQITVESEQVQIQFGQINDTWKKILKRIVVNPLITSAPLLNNKTSRNQQIASTLAEINGEKFDISNIASEGQIADLQLSFILAMANKYSWTPWKALLLDDPMQHHDLVHASSAFDVLRDYIVELNYQIMLSTHDPLQADFFVRKLKNDGITSKVYQLIPGKGGITAERIG